jgi:hypothetical protein
MPTQIVFGPPLPSEPSSSGAIHSIRQIWGENLDSMMVWDEPGDVAHRLGSEAGLIQVERMWQRDRIPVWINPAHVRYVTEYKSRAGSGEETE